MWLERGLRPLASGTPLAAAKNVLGPISVYAALWLRKRPVKATLIYRKGSAAITHRLGGCGGAVQTGNDHGYVARSTCLWIGRRESLDIAQVGSRSSDIFRRCETLSRAGVQQEHMLPHSGRWNQTVPNPLQFLDATQRPLIPT